MTPLQIVADVVTIARIIHHQVQLTKSNQAALRTLSEIISHVTGSLDGLSSLPEQQQFIDSLEAFQICCQKTQTFIVAFAEKSWMNAFIRAGHYEKKINRLKQHILELVPFLNLSLAAQQLMDNHKNRLQDEQDKAADFAYFMAQQEKRLREIQAQALKASDLEAIVRRQMVSVKNHLDAQKALPSTVESPQLPEALRVNLYDIVFTRKIGESRLGDRYEGTWNGTPVTLQWVEGILTPSQHQQWVREVHILSRLHHDHIIPFHGAAIEPHQICLVLGKTKPLTLRAISALSLPERLTLAQHLSKGLHYLHQHQMIHGAIHIDHIGLNAHDQAQWTELSWVKTHAMGIVSAGEHHNDPLWQAPESQSREALTQHSDIYSFGVLLWTWISGKLPTPSNQDNLTAIQQGFHEPLPNDCPPECRVLIEACLSPAPGQRPNASELIEALDKLLRPPSPTGDELYEQGVSAERANNLIEAHHYHTRAVQKNEYRSYTSLGFFALKGLGETPDKQKAQTYFERAANSGHVRAMGYLGRLHEKGDTATGQIDNVKALFWYQKAATASPETPKYQNKVLLLSAQLDNATPHQNLQRK